MSAITAIFVGGTLLLAFITDANGTTRLVATAISVRGVTWIVKKVLQNIDLGASQIIDFAGWSIAGVSIVGIISRAMASVGRVSTFFMAIANFLDKITFWS